MTIMHEQRVEITVTGDCGHVLGTWTDTVEDKYPFYCEECDDDKRTGRYPWKLTTRIISAAPVIVSTSWKCSGCGGQCIGAVPESHLCRGCGGDGK